MSVIPLLDGRHTTAIVYFPVIKVTVRCTLGDDAEIGIRCRPARAAQRCQARISRSSAVTGVGSCSNTSPGRASLLPGFWSSITVEYSSTVAQRRLDSKGRSRSFPPPDLTWPAVMPASRVARSAGAGQFLGS